MLFIPCSAAATDGNATMRLAKTLGSKILLLLLGYLLMAGVVRLAHGQQRYPATALQPDCVQFFQLASVTDGGSFDNRQVGCTTWTVAYQSTGFTVISLQFESAPPGTDTTPGAFVAFAGTLVSGINPNTAITQASSQFSGYFPWVRINATALTGAGVIRGLLYGYRQPNVASVAISGNVAVVGPTAAGAASTTNPVQVGVIDTTGNVVKLVGNANGLFVQGRSAAGSIPVNNPTPIGGLDNGGTLRSFLATSIGQASVSSPLTGADAVGNGSLGSMVNSAAGGVGYLGIAPIIFNNTTWDRFRSASLSNFPLATTLTARNSIGAATTEKGSRWMVISNPAAGSQATASIAAEASVRHVVDCIAFSAAATTAPALTALTVNVRDGATGAGTIIWTYQVAIAAATGQSVAPHSICGLNLTGTTNTAMTLEFSAALANLIESVSISGFNVN